MILFHINEGLLIAAINRDLSEACRASQKKIDVKDQLRSAEDTGIFKIDRYLFYFLFLTYLAQFKRHF